MYILIELRICIIASLEFGIINRVLCSLCVLQIQFQIFWPVNPDPYPCFFLLLVGKIMIEITLFTIIQIVGKNCKILYDRSEHVAHACIKIDLSENLICDCSRFSQMP